MGIMEKYVDASHRDWEEKLTAAVYAINTTVHAVTKVSPFFLIHGRDPFLPCDAMLPTNTKKLHDDSPEERKNRVLRALQEAKRNTVKFQTQVKDRFDAKHPSVEYRPGDLVLHAD